MAGNENPWVLSWQLEMDHPTCCTVILRMLPGPEQDDRVHFEALSLAWSWYVCYCPGGGLLHILTYAYVLNNAPSRHTNFKHIFVYFPKICEAHPQCNVNGFFLMFLST